MKRFFVNFFKSRKRTAAFTAVLIVICMAIAFIYRAGTAEKDSDALASGGSTGYVTRGSISNELSSSGTLSPKNTYSITSLVSGEITEADFEEGDQVTAGQTLYVIDTSEISSDIESAERSLEKAQKEYQEAASDKAKALAKLNNGTVLSGKTGYIKNLTLKAGDSVSKDTKIAELYNDAEMTFRAAFLDTDAAKLQVGQDIVAELNDTGETIPGRIKAIGDLTETLEGGIPVRYAEICVSNPGGLTESDTANAYVGDIHSLSSGTFSAVKSEDFKLDITQNITVENVLVSEGQYVTAGTPLFTATPDSLSEALRTINDSADNAEESLKNAENQKNKLDETVGKYTITAPISGQVITKNLRVGEKVNSSNSTTSQLALIYDLSELTFQMSIDELDISKVKVGQEVKVTADAFDGKTFTGHVTNVGLNGTASNGVTTYPVVVTLDDMDGLLPGMNVEGTIILEKSDNTLIIPSGALQRGDIVYVRNTSDSAQTSDGENTAASGEKNHGSAPYGEKPEKPEDGNDSGRAESGKTDLEAARGDEGEGGSEAGANGQKQYLGDAPEGYTAVSVTTGIVSDNYVEILSGLSEGQEIYVKDTVSDGFDWDSDMFMDGGQGGDAHGGGGPDGGGHGGP